MTEDEALSVPFQGMTALDKRNMCEKIMTDVCRKRGIDRSALLADTRVREVTHARHEVWWRIIHEVPSMTHSAMSRLFNRDRATIIYGVRQHENRRRKTNAS